MSKKAEALLQKFGGAIASTVGHRPEAVPGAGGGAGGAAPPPDRYAGATRSRCFAEMPVDAIIAGEQPRTEFDDEELRRLAESIQRFGQLAPIRVRYDEPTGRWIVLVGERRLRACRLAGLERIRVELVERAMTDADILAEQIVENAVRADLQPVEQARAYRRLMDLNGWTAQDVAESLGIEPTKVYRALALLKLPEEVAAQVDAGAIKATAGYELTKLPDAESQRAVARQIVEEGLDHGATVAEVRRRQAAAPSARRGRAAPRKGRGLAEQKHRGPRGVTVTIRTTARHTPADVAADLRTLADRIEAEAPASEVPDAA